MLIVTCSQSCIYNTESIIKILWYNFDYFSLCSSFFLEAYFVIDQLSKEAEQTDKHYINCLMTKRVIKDISCKT